MLTQEIRKELRINLDRVYKSVKSVEDKMKFKFSVEKMWDVLMVRYAKCCK